jgi:tetratricopeptide (TPR) repeat protein
MSARDQLYVDAWVAEVDEPGKALQKWQQMATLYPDFFQASANVGYKLHESNRFAEGIPFAKRATSKQYELSGLSWDLAGRLSLGLERYADAEKAFGTALELGAGTSAIRLANTLAAQRRFEGADAVLSRNGKVGPDYFDPVTLALDRGEWSSAAGTAQALAPALQAGSMRQRASLYPVAVVDWMRGDDKAALRGLGKMAKQTLSVIEAHPNKADAVDEAFAVVAAGILAQRMGDRTLPAEIVRRMEDQQELLKTDPLDALFVVLKANDLRLSGDSGGAIKLLKPLLDGSEPFQAHVALAEAYASASEPQKALEEIRWVVRSRGRAYTEIGCSWCQQPLNVVDTTLSHLRAAELLAGTGKSDDARRELRSFDQYWAKEDLPPHLRVRRESVLGTFK